MSTFTIRAVVEALKWLNPGQTALLRGRHGIGKSAIAYMMAELWKIDTVIERRISQLSEGDMIGLPDRGAVKIFNDEQWNVTQFLPTDWFLEAQFKPCLVFLDEINRGTPETMQACFQFVEKGELNGRKIHPESRIIAAVNYSKEYQVTPMDPAFLDRFWVADIEPDKQDWLTWAKTRGKISDITISFISQCNDSHFEILPKDMAKVGSHEIMPSRRSWERLDKHVNKQNKDGQSLISDGSSQTLYDVCRGFVGADAARAFVKYVSDNENIVTADDIINKFNDEIKNKLKKLHPENKIALIDKILSMLNNDKMILSDEQATNISKFMRVLTPEIAMSLHSGLQRLKNPTNVIKLHEKIGDYVTQIITKTKFSNNLGKK